MGSTFVVNPSLGISMSTPLGEAPIWRNRSPMLDHSLIVDAGFGYVFGNPLYAVSRLSGIDRA